MITIFNICKYYIVDKFGCLRPHWRAPCSNPGRVKSFARTHWLQWFWVSDVKWCEMVQPFWSVGELGVIQHDSTIDCIKFTRINSGDEPCVSMSRFCFVFQWCGSRNPGLIPRDPCRSRRSSTGIRLGYVLCAQILWRLQLSEVGNLEKGTYRHNINVYQCQIDFGGTKSWQYQLYGFVGFMSCNILIMIVEKIHNVTDLLQPTLSQTHNSDFIMCLLYSRF